MESEIKNDRKRKRCKRERKTEIGKQKVTKRHGIMWFPQIGFALFFWVKSMRILKNKITNWLQMCSDFRASFGVIEGKGSKCFFHSLLSLNCLLPQAFLGLFCESFTLQLLTGFWQLLFFSKRAFKVFIVDYS